MYDKGRQLECTKEINNAQGANAVAMEDMTELGVLTEKVFVGKTNDEQ